VSDPPVSRQHLLTGMSDARIDRIEVHRVRLTPGQQTGPHHHIGGVVGSVVDGRIDFEIEGKPPVTLEPGSVFYEPPGATIRRFNNLSATDEAVFLAYYPLSGAQPLITFDQ
jgi:quercetin dioxygenase-like cupin family protein